MLTHVESTEYSRATTVVYTQEYPITLAMVGIGQMSRPNARCLHIEFHLSTMFVRPPTVDHTRISKGTNTYITLLINIHIYFREKSSHKKLNNK